MFASHSCCSTVTVTPHALVNNVTLAIFPVDGNVLAASQACQSGSLPDVVSGNAYFLVYRQIVSPFGGSDSIAVATQQAADTAAAAAGNGSLRLEDLAGEVTDVPSQMVGISAAGDSGGGDAAVGVAAEAGGGSDDRQESLLQRVFVGGLLQQLQALPSELQQRVAELHQQFAAACMGFTQERQQALQRVTQRREVRATRHAAAAAALLPLLC